MENEKWGEAGGIQGVQRVGTRRGSNEKILDLEKYLKKYRGQDMMTLSPILST